jgi:hypothetical protein
MRKLTMPEVDQLFFYWEETEISGTYYGNQKHFAKRHKALEKWLHELVEETRADLQHNPHP